MYSYKDWFDKYGCELVDIDGEYLSDEELEDEYQTYISDYEDYKYEEYRDRRMEDV